MKLLGERIFLRKWRKADAGRLAEICQDEGIKKFTRVPDEYSITDAFEFLDRVRKNEIKKEELGFAIVLKESKKIIGSIGLIHINWKDFNAEIGFMLDRDFRGKGFVPEAVNILLNHAFNELGLERIVLRCEPGNPQSRKVIEKAGGKFEGIARHVIYNKGSFRDLRQYSILRKEFLGKSNK